MCTGGSGVAGSAAEALALIEAGLDYLNGPAAGELVATELGGILEALSRTGAKHAAAWHTFLSRFDANDCHDEDGYQTSAAWLAARTQTKLSSARGRVRQMRNLSTRPLLGQAMADGRLSESWAADIIAWTKPLPPEMRDDVDRILLDAAAAGAELDDLAVLARAAVEQWKSQRPDEDPGDGSGGAAGDGDGDGDGFSDRGVSLGHTFGGAARLTGDLSGECAAAVQAVLDALGKKRGPEDRRTRSQRFHDGLQEACELLIRAKMVPARAGSDTRVDAVISLRDLLALPGARAVEDAWLASATGHHLYLTGTAAETIACDAMITPVVTGTADWTTITAIIDLIAAALTATSHGISHGTASHGTGTRPGGAEDRSGEDSRAPGNGSQQGGSAGQANAGHVSDEGQDRGTVREGCGEGASSTSGHAGSAGQGEITGGDMAGGRGLPPQPAGLALTPGEWDALLNAVARLSVRFVSGPGGLASALRRTLLPAPYSSRSVPLDVGFSQTIPEPIRRAVQLRDRRCRWPGGCDRPPSACDIHHVKHKKDGGPTSVQSCLLLCNFHHDVCVHRWGWSIELLPGGEVRACGPLGQVLSGHGPPPPARAA